jgi:hypothetical protein
MWNDVIPCVGGLGFFLILFGFIAIMRLISYRETLVLAEKGLVKAPKNGGGKETLRWGIAITAVGMALCLGMWPIGLASGFSGSHQYPLGFGPWMLVGLVPTFFGLALVLIYVLTREREEKPQEPPEAPKVE